MAKPIRIDNFSGYTSRKDHVTRDPSLGILAHNCIVNKGDLCNLPYAMQKRTTTPFNGDVLATALFYEALPGRNRLIKLFGFRPSGATSDGTIFVVSTEDTRYLTDPIDTHVDVISFGLRSLMPDYMPWTVLNKSFQNGNFLPVGNHLFCVAPLTGNLNLAGATVPGSMLRFGTVQEYDFNNLEPFLGRLINVAMPIGLDQPSNVLLENHSSSGLIPAGTYEVAITFVTNIQKLTTTTTISGGVPKIAYLANMHPEDIESSATISNEVAATASTNRIFKVSINSPRPGQAFYNLRGIPIGLGVYMKNVSQSVYYFLGYIPDFNSLPEGDNNTKVLYLHDFNQVLTRTAPLTGTNGPIIGAHDKPRPAYHAVQFKSRMYYFCSLIDPKNLMMISSTVTDQDPSQAKAFCYIESQLQIGRDDEGFGGAVEFLGQLIIFKESETFILTDDIQAGGSLRPLFDNVGCVNVAGGKAYVNINNVIYWLAKDGVYAYSGTGTGPIKLSDVISEDLAAIPKQDYRLARFAVDTRYSLLFLIIPNQKTFVFHYNELDANGERKIKWTTVDELLNVFNTSGQEDTTNVTYYIKKRELGLAGLIHEFIEDESNGRSVLWQSSYLDYGYSGKKHWKTFQYVDRLGTFKFRHSDQGAPDVSFRKILSSENPFTQVFIENDATLVSVNIHSELLAMGLQTFTHRSFRIGGYELDAHIKGLARSGQNRTA